MELKEYEQIKFQLAEIIRKASLLDTERDKGIVERWRPLLVRLAEDRFNVVVAGRFSQGKSTLMNALLGMDRLPTGIVPITSVLTTVRHGTSERVRIEYEAGTLPIEIPLRDLADYVTESGNPGNQRGIRMAEIQLPAEILRRGFYFVDTPGLGSAILANTETTERFIPEIDMLILVTSYGSPMSQDEVGFLLQAASSGRPIFVVLNKHDMVSPKIRPEVLAYAGRVVREILGVASRAPFSVSARDGLAAKQANDGEALRASGILDFENELLQFLTAHKTAIFLNAMCERILAAASATDNSAVGNIIPETLALQQRITSLAGNDRRIPEDDGALRLTPSAKPCEMCRAVAKKVFEFLRHYQYVLSNQADCQERHAEDGGFCAMHTWHYEQITSPRGVCTAYPALLNRQADRLRVLLRDQTETGLPNPLWEARCPACAVRMDTEKQAVRSLLSRVVAAQSSNEVAVPALCLPHLRQVLKAAPDNTLAKSLIEHEAALLERLAEDMLRYAMRHDALKRSLVSEEERSAPIRTLQMLVGDKNVNAVFTIEEIA